MRRQSLAQQDAGRLNTPAWLSAAGRGHYGEETARQIAAAHLEEPALDLSVKADAADWAARLGGELLPSGTVRVSAQRPHRGYRGLCGRRVVGAGCRRRLARAVAWRCAGLARGRPLRGARRKDGGTCGARRACDRRRPFRLAPAPAEGEPGPARARSRDRARECGGMGRARAFRRGAARCALLGDRHDPAQPRYPLSQVRRPISRRFPACRRGCSITR